MGPFVDGFITGSYIIGMLFMAFFGHVICCPDPNVSKNDVGMRIITSILWPGLAIIFLICRFFRAIDIFFDFGGSK